LVILPALQPTFLRNPAIASAASAAYKSRKKWVAGAVDYPHPPLGAVCERAKLAGPTTWRFAEAI
jgi:hypothetical protein